MTEMTNEPMVTLRQAMAEIGRAVGASRETITWVAGEIDRLTAERDQARASLARSQELLQAKHRSEVAALNESARLSDENKRLRATNLADINNDVLWLTRLAKGSSWPGEMAQRVEDAANRVQDALAAPEPTGSTEDSVE